MRIFRVQEYAADTCGNRWFPEGGIDIYVKAESEKDLAFIYNVKFLGGFYITEVKLISIGMLKNQYNKKFPKKEYYKESSSPPTFDDYDSYECDDPIF